MLVFRKNTKAVCSMIYRDSGSSYRQRPGVYGRPQQPRRLLVEVLRITQDVLYFFGFSSPHFPSARHTSSLCPNCCNTYQHVRPNGLQEAMVVNRLECHGGIHQADVHVAHVQEERLPTLEQALFVRFHTFSRELRPSNFDGLILACAPLQAIPQKYWPSSSSRNSSAACGQ